MLTMSCWGFTEPPLKSSLIIYDCDTQRPNHLTSWCHGANNYSVYSRSSSPVAQCNEHHQLSVPPGQHSCVLFATMICCTENTEHHLILIESFHTVSKQLVHRSLIFLSSSLWYDFSCRETCALFSASVPGVMKSGCLPNTCPTDRQLSISLLLLLLHHLSRAWRCSYADDKRGNELHLWYGRFSRFVLCFVFPCYLHLSSETSSSFFIHAKKYLHLKTEVLFHTGL